MFPLSRREREKRNLKLLITSCYICNALQSSVFGNTKDSPIIVFLPVCVVHCTLNPDAGLLTCDLVPERVVTACHWGMIFLCMWCPKLCMLPWIGGLLSLTLLLGSQNASRSPHGRGGRVVSMSSQGQQGLLEPIKAAPSSSCLRYLSPNVTLVSAA